MAQEAAHGVGHTSLARAKRVCRANGLDTVKAGQVADMSEALEDAHRRIRLLERARELDAATLDERWDEIQRLRKQLRISGSLVRGLERALKDVSAWADAAKELVQ